MEKLNDLLAKKGFNEEDIKNITGCLTESKYVPEDCVPRARLNEEIEKKKALQEQVDTVNKQFDELKKKAGSNEDLVKKVEKLESDLKIAQEESDKKIAEYNKMTAIKSEFAGDVYDADYIYSKLDLDKISYDEKTKKVFSGLKEQLDEMKNNEALKVQFKEANSGVAGGYQPLGGQQTPPPQKQELSSAEKRVEEYFASKK